MLHTNDQRLFYGDNGIGIVLIHGVTSGCAQMIPLARNLNDISYSQRTPDSRIDHYRTNRITMIIPKSTLS